MQIASHNSWSYLPPKKWWMKLLSFTAKCQDVDIMTQYKDYNVRCFDLRVRFDSKGRVQIVHGMIVYDIELIDFFYQLTLLNLHKDVYIRVILDVRTKSQYTYNQIVNFRNFCADLEDRFKDIKFYCGQSLYKRVVEYEFKCKGVTCVEKYASVQQPKIIDDWYPRLYAAIVNQTLNKYDDNAQFLMVDFVNYL